VEDSLLQFHSSGGLRSRGQLSLLKSNPVSPTRNNNVAKWPKGNDMIMLLCSGLNRTRSLSSVCAVFLDYTDMQGLSKQKPGALSSNLVWHKNSSFSRTLACVSLAIEKRSLIHFHTGILLDISVKRSHSIQT